jgi:hypothetical protein
LKTGPLMDSICGVQRKSEKRVMYIVMGVARAGKVDVAPDLFHVESDFGHVYYVPIIPLKSFLVLKPHLGQREVAIPLSFKSIFFGWLRGGSLVAFGGFLIAGIIQFVDNKPNPALGTIFLSIAGVALAALVGSYLVKPLTAASYDRAVALARTAGFTPMGLLTVEVAYGRMNPQQADAYLARIDEQEAVRVNNAVPATAKPPMPARP